MSEELELDFAGDLDVPGFYPPEERLFFIVKGLWDASFSVLATLQTLELEQEVEGDASEKRTLFYIRVSQAVGLATLYYKADEPTHEMKDAMLKAAKLFTASDILAPDSPFLPFQSAGYYQPFRMFWLEVLSELS